MLLGLAEADGAFAGVVEPAVQGVDGPALAQLPGGLAPVGRATNIICT
ncbi:hypothetical protein ACQEVG_37210 [Streptomyces sp. CA-135486]